MNKFERYLNKDPSALETLGSVIFTFLVCAGLLYLSFVYPVVAFLIVTPAILFPVYKFIKGVWDA